MGHARSEISKTTVIAGAGCILISSMVWTVLTESRLNDAFWPRDIGDRVVAAFGGTVNIRAAADRRIELAWISVSFRIAVTLILAATATALWISLWSGESAGKDFRNRFIDGFVSAISAIAQPWLLAAVWLMAWILGTSMSNPEPLNFMQLITPLSAALIGALSLNGFCNAIESRAVFLREPRNPAIDGSQRHKELLILIVAGLCWEGMSFWMNERLYAGLLVPHGDSAMYEEHLWNVWHGKGFRSYLDQGLFLGEHIQVIHLLLLPLHCLWPSYLMLELAASCSLAICIIPIYSIARRHSRSSRAALWLGLAWLFFFPMHYLDIAIDLKTLRPSCYGLPFLFWGIDFAERRRLLSSSVCFLIALTTQEDFALVVGSIGIVLLLFSWKKSEAVSASDARRFTAWTAGLVLFSVAWVLLAVLVVIPAFRGGDAVHYSRYFGELGSSPGDLVRSAVHTPGKVFSQLFSLRTLFYVLVLTAPIGLSPLRKPVYLIGCTATFCMLSLIQLGNSVGATNVSGLSELPPIPYHHFHAPLLPVLFWAAAASLHTTNEVSAARFIFLSATLTAITSSLMPFGSTFWSETSPFSRHRLYVPGERASEFEKILATLPADARIASTDYVHTRLTHFERSYDYSGYPRAVNNYQPGVPADTDYIVIDTGHHYSEIKSIDQVRELQQEPDEWEVIPNDSKGLFIVLKRKRRAVAKPALRDGSDPETAQLQ